MDNVTHGLWGLGIYGGWVALANPPQHSALAVGVCIAAVVGSEAPDFDFVIRWAFGPVAYLRQHRAISHSLPLLFLWPLFISLILSIWWPGNVGLLYSISFLGVFIHIALDVLTTYGTQVLWPFSRHRWSFDVLFIVDVVMLICGVLGVALVASRAWSMAQAVFVLGSVVMFYLALRCVQAAYLYNRIRQKFPFPWRISAIPGPLPWLWSFVAQNDEELMAGKLGLNGEIKREIRWHWPKRDETALSFAVRFSKVGSVFYWFARHLIWAESRDEGGLRISFADVTYRFGRTLPFTGYVRLKKLESGRYKVQEESVRGQAADWKALLQDAILSDERTPVAAQVPSEKK